MAAKSYLKEGAQKKKGGGGGILSSLKSGPAGALSNILDVLNAPQQALYKPIQGIRKTLQGEGIDETLKGFKRGAGEVGSLVAGMALPFVGSKLMDISGPDISFSETIGAKKLPWGVETLARTATDPVTYLTLGAGGAAKTALKEVGEAGLKSVADDIASQGLRKTLKAGADEAAIRGALRNAAVKAGAKNVDKTAARGFSSLKRAQGGIGFHVPFTDITGNVVKGSTVKAGAEKIGLNPLGRSIKNSPIGSGVRHALIPGAKAADDPNVGRSAFTAFKEALGSRTSAQSKMVEDARKEWDAAIRAVKGRGHVYTQADDELVSRALQGGVASRASLAAARPELEPVISATDRIRKALGESQFKAGVLGQDSNALRAKAQIKVDKASAAVAKQKDKSATLLKEAKAARKSGDTQQIVLLNRRLGKSLGKEAKLATPLRQATEKLKAIVPDSRAGMRDPETYLRRVLTPEARAVLGKDKDTISRLTQQVRGVGSAEQKAAQARRIAPGLTVQEINEGIDLLRSGTTAGVHPELLKSKDFLKLADAFASKPGVKLFQEGTGVPLLTRQAEGAIAVATANLVTDLQAVRGTAGRPIFMSDEAWKTAAKSDPELALFKEVSVPGVGKFRVPAGIEGEVQNALRVMGHDETITGFFKALGQMQALWKTYATAMLPGGIPFAMRNARSNVYLNILDGMPPTSPAYKRAYDMLHDVRKIVKGSKHSEAVARDGLDTVLRRELGDETFDLYRAAQDRGIIDKGFFDIDFGDLPIAQQKLGIKGAPKASLGRRSLRQLGTQGAMAKKGRGINEAIEHHSRLSNFLYNVEKLGNLDEAAKRTKTVLFDYADLTPFEQKIMKNINPFYTFMRKNIPQQLKTMASNPARIKIPETIADAMTDPVDESAPDYQQRAGSRTLKPEIGKFLPGGLQGFVSTPDRPLAAAADALDPLTALVGAVGHGAGIKSLAGSKPESYQSFFRSVAEPVGGVVPGILKLIQEEGAGKSAFTGGRLPDDSGARARRLVDAVVPGLGRVPRTGAIAKVNEYLGGRGSRGTKESELLRYLLGLRLDEAQDGGGTGGAVKSYLK